MAYDFAGGFNQGQYNPGGFAGRQQGGRFAATYGYDENGNPRPGPGQTAPTPAPAPMQPNTGMAPIGQQSDFFAQLAGLLGPQGAAAPPTTMGAGGGGATNGPYGANAYAQNAARMQGLRDASQGFQYTTSGGQGPTGGVSREVQQGGMRGRMMAQGSMGRASGGRTNPGIPAAQGATPMPKPRPLPNMNKPGTPMQANPVQNVGRPGQFGNLGTTQRKAGVFGGRM
jgi:hypothetical protein